MSRVIQATGSSACISTPNSSWEGPTTTGRSPFLGFWPQRRRFPGSLLELTLSVKFICVAFRAFEEHAAAILPVSAAGRPGAGSPTAPWWLAFEAAYHAEEKVAFEHISCASYLLARVSLGAHMQCGGAHSQGAVREDWGVFMQGWNPSASAAWLSCRLCSCGLSLPLPLHCQGMSSV